MSDIEQTRAKGMLESLQQTDPSIDQIVIYSKFVVAYLLQQDGPSPGWRKANIEGPVYLVRRRGTPRFQLLVKNQFSTNDLLDHLHPDWELDCQKNYVFYKVEDPVKRIRGLWFHDDAERRKMEAALDKMLKEIRAGPADPQPEPPQSQELGLAANAQQGKSFAGPQDSVTVTTASLRAALHSLVDDEVFIKAVMQKLQAHKPPGA